jgi:hypothetical protein
MQSESLRRPETEAYKTSTERRLLLEADIEAYLNAGGKIDEIEIGKTGLCDSGLSHGIQKDRLRGQKSAARATHNRK